MKLGTILLWTIIFSSVTLTSCWKSKPRILIVGDSISIGYTPFVKEYFSDRAVVMHNPGNAQHTGTGLDSIANWIGDGNWDIIQFNWGLWDLCYRSRDVKEPLKRDKLNGKVTNSLGDYTLNLDSIVSVLREKTKAKLIFVTTTSVPENEPGRYQDDVLKYNDAARSIMKEHAVLVNDIYDQSVYIHGKYGKGNSDVHYGNEGYKQLGKLVADFLEREIDQ
ncbi:MAG: SGNH/GDSL hydrolase family protein [Flavobacteriaceae bacterium]